MADTQPLLPGDPERLGDYELTGRLGEGGQGIVFLGRSPDGEKVAVKLLLAQLTGDAAARNRFVRELAVTKQVAGFCTAEVLDADVAGDRPYIVSEYVEGPSLRELVRDEGPRRGSALMRLAIGTATALAAIHQQGIVHRDFKPPNVLMGPDGPRVIDFGVARALDANAVTMTSQVVGTPAYMAPEQVAGGAVGAPADMFAWGATIAYAATGDSPFGNDSIPAVMHRIMHGDPDLSGLPEPLRELVARCLAKNPAQRPTAHAVLLRLVGGIGGPAPAPDSRIEPALAQGAQLAVSDLPSSGWQPGNPPPPPMSTTGPQGRTGPPMGPNTGPPMGPNTGPPMGHTGPRTGPRSGPPAAPPTMPPTMPPGTGSPSGSPGTPAGPGRRRRRLLLALAAPAAVLLVVGTVVGISLLAGGEDNPGGDLPKSVKIGFVGDLTGALSASIGPPMLKSTKLAIDEYNATGPRVRAELVTADTMGRADQVPAAIQKLSSAGVAAVIGPLLPAESAAAGQLLERERIPNIAVAATDRALSGKGWRYWHRMVASDQTVARSGAAFIVRAIKPDRVFVVDDRTGYTQNQAADLSAVLKDNEIDVDTARIDERAADHSATIDEIRAADADLIFYGGAAEDAARLIEQAREARVRTRFMLSDAAVAATLANEDETEGTVITCACFDAQQGDTPEARTFRQHYQAAFKIEPGYYTAEGYEAALALLAVLKEGKVTGEQINQRLATVDVAGAPRRVRFAATGEPADPSVYVYQVRAGGFHLIGDTKTANL